MNQEVKQKAMALFEQQKFNEADRYLQQHQRQHQTDAEYWYIYAGVKGLAGDMQSAENFCRKATALDSSFALAWFRLANALDVQGKHSQALEYFDIALSLQSDFAHCWNNKGVALMALSLAPDAEHCYRKALKIDQSTLEFTINLGLSCLAQVKISEAISHFEQVLQVSPNNVEAGWSLANALLALGHYDRGWKYYDLRWQRPEKAKQKTYQQVLWRGEPLAGKTLFIYPEQGLGDFIQFIRFMPMVKDSGAYTIVQCPKPLLSIMGAVSGIDQWVTSDENVQFDYQVPIANLPGLFIRKDSDIPLTSSYLGHGYHSRSDDMFDTEKLKVGLVWSGNPKQSNDFNRSTSLEKFVPLFGMAGIQFYSVQKDRVTNKVQEILARHQVKELGSSISDFSDTVSILKSLDIMLSVDTSVAHLAGALGIKTYVMLAYCPDWRWQLNCRDSVWYESAILIRQKAIGDWGSVVSEVKQELMRLTSEQ